MERTIYNKQGDTIAYFSDDYYETVYLWDGSPVAYVYDERHLYGLNGRHLGWFIDEIIYDNNGERIGFTLRSCPVSVAKEEPKPRKRARDELRSKWSAPPMPKLSSLSATRELEDFLREGEVSRLPGRSTPEGPEDTET